MSNRDGIRVALIGCGVLARTQFVPALRRIAWIPDVLIDPASHQAEALALELGELGKPVIASDWTAAADRFDVAIVVVPNAWHGAVGTALVAAGKHLLMEPPFATQGAACRAVAEAAERSGTVLLAAHPRRHLHAMRWTEAVIRSGALGSLRRIDWREGSAFDRSGATDVMLRPEEGGVLTNPGVHALDLLSWWLGDITPLHYRDDCVGGVESECVLHCRVGETEAKIELSRSRELPNTCFIEGSKGFVEVHLHRGEVIRCSEGVRRVQFQGLEADAMPPQQPADLLLATLEEFRATVHRSGGRRRVNDHDRDAAELIERCYAMRAPIERTWETATRSGATVIAAGTRVVVTGATGFIGGRLVKRLVEQGALVCCLIRSPASAIHLARLPVEFRQVDLTDKGAVDDALGGAELVFHCAYDWGNAGANGRGMGNLIEACIAHGIERFVHVSTFSVYDPYPNGDLNETAPDGDRSLEYTRIKLELEKDLLDAVRERGLRGTILQPTIVYGPFSKPWTISPAEMLMYDTVVLPDCGEGLCNPLFVDDFVEALLLAATRSEAVGERFIVSGPDVVTWSEFYETLAQSIGAKGPEYWPRDAIIKWKSGLRHKVGVAISDPKKVVRIAMRVPGVRGVLNRSWQMLPVGLRQRIEARYDRKLRRVGQLHVPSRSQLRNLMAKPVVVSGKARRLIGYYPRVDFRSGMVATTRYLEVTYGVKAQREKSVAAGMQPGQGASMTTAARQGL